jgi:PAS domain S-box-containing protein
MDGLIRILHLEDSKFDAEVAERELRLSKMPYERMWVTNKKDFMNALRDYYPDIVLSDHSLPSFSSVEALKMTRDMGLDVPFILVTGTISEEFAVNMLQTGAADYLLKDRMQRLPNAILNAMKKFHAEKEKQAYFEEVKRNEIRYRALIENISDGIILINQEGRFTYCSPSVGLITGYSSDELALLSLFDLIYREDLEDAKLFFQEISKQPGVTRQRQYRIMTKNDNVIWVEGTINNRLHDENVKAFIVNYRDITERKHSEMATLELVEKLQRKNNDLRQFAFIVSHDLRAPIAKLQGLLELMNDEDDVASRNVLMKYINDEVNSLDGVVNDMNEIVAVGESANMKRETVVFADKLALMQSVLRTEIQESQALIVSDFEVPFIVSVRGYIYSIMYNLLSNALKYRSPMRPLRVRLHTMENKGYVQLSVADNGIGIDTRKDGERIFTLYKRVAARQANGKGMGLHMVKIQVESLGGYVEVESKEGVGSVFNVFLPKSA